MRDAQALDVFARELQDSVCISPLLPTPFIGLRYLKIHATLC